MYTMDPTRGPDWRTLEPFYYRVPEEAKPYFLRALAARREQFGAAGHCKVIDLGCSYGVNGALLRFNLSIADIHRRYGTEHAASLHRAALLRRDRGLAAHPGLQGVRFVGIDVSRNAAAYALEAGFVDDIIIANLEQRALAPDEQALIADADLVFSTGCIGYASAETLERILQSKRRPRALDGAHCAAHVRSTGDGAGPCAIWLHDCAKPTVGAPTPLYLAAGARANPRYAEPPRARFLGS